MLFWRWKGSEFETRNYGRKWQLKYQWGTHQQNNASRQTGETPSSTDRWNNASRRTGEIPSSTDWWNNTSTRVGEIPLHTDNWNDIWTQTGGTPSHVRRWYNVKPPLHWVRISRVCLRIAGFCKFSKNPPKTYRIGSAHCVRSYTLIVYVSMRICTCYTFQSVFRRVWLGSYTCDTSSYTLSDVLHTYPYVFSCFFLRFDKFQYVLISCYTFIYVYIGIYTLSIRV